MDDERAARGDPLGAVTVVGGAGAPAGEVDGAAAAPAPGARSTSGGGSAWGRGRLVLQWVLFGAPVVLSAVMGWARRWMSDDGYIHLRVVQQLLAGNGPVFNAGERVEASTSPLWVFVLAGLKWSVLRFVELPWIAVGVGVAAMAGALAVATVAARRLWRSTAEGLLVPVGALVVAGLAPFWDYATSGLEVGLVLLWIASAWWALVALLSRPDGSPVSTRRVWATGALFGLSWLVRPEMALFAVLFLVAALVVDRGGRHRAVAWVGATAVIPVAFEVFRAGYYASLLPNTALAKDASGAAWRQGVTYLGDFVVPYRLWIPAVALAVIAAFAVARLAGDGRWDRLVVAAAPVVGGTLVALYVVRVGGDWMHARLLLPPLFALVLPVTIVPLDLAAGARRDREGRPRAVGRAVAQVGIVVVAVWSLVAAGGLRHTVGTTGHVDGRKVTVPVAHSIIDARRGTQLIAPSGDLVSASDMWSAQGSRARRGARAHRLELIVVTGMDHLLVLPLAADRRSPVWRVGAIGVMSYVAGPSVYVEDWLGLANPVGSRIPADPENDAPGHRKVLPVAWTLARFAAPGARSLPAPRREVAAAREALGCGRLAALMRRISEPLTPRRFVANLVHAPSTTRLRVPADPVAARDHFCGRPGT